jgi:ELWxxDGT repeat protein
VEAGANPGLRNFGGSYSVPSRIIAEGTLQVRSTRRVEQPTAMGGVLYFFEEEPLDTQVLWRTDGTEAGTWRVKELPRIWWLEGSSLSEMLAVEPEGRLIFAAADASGVEPWVSDGTPEGT